MDRSCPAVYRLRHGDLVTGRRQGLTSQMSGIADPPFVTVRVSGSLWMA